MDSKDSLRILPGRLPGVVFAYPSKSMSHRALFLAAQNPDGAVITNLSRCDDVLATVSALRSCGFSVTEEGEETRVCPGKAPAFAQIDCASSGSTLRFIIPYLAAHGIPARIVGSEQLAKRPVDEYKTLFADQPLTVNSRLPICLSGHIGGGSYTLSGKISSQYATGLLLAAGSLAEMSYFNIPRGSVSYPYIRMTVSMMRDFGIRVEEKDESLLVRGGQRITRSRYTVEGDWSLASFWLCLGAALSPEGLTVRGLQPASVQGDAHLLRIFERIGVPYDQTEDGIRVYGRPVCGTYCFDLHDHPDLFPVLCAYFALTKACVTFTGLGALQYKESDRIRSVVGALGALGASVAACEDSVTVNGSESRFRPGQADLKGDHRVAFACALWALGSGSELELNGASCVEKSWPTFCEELESLGLAQKGE